MCCRVTHVGTLTFRGAVCLPVTHRHQTEVLRDLYGTFVQTGTRSSTLKAFHCDVCISRHLSLWFSNYEQILRGEKLIGILQIFHVAVSDQRQASQFRKCFSWPYLEVARTHAHDPHNLILHPLCYICFFHLHFSSHMFLLGFLSLPPGALSLTDWKLISTQLTFHEHWGAFLPILTQFKLFSWRHFTLTSRTAALRGTEEVDRGQGRVLGQFI